MANWFSQEHFQKHPMGYMLGGMGAAGMGLGASGAFGKGMGNFLTGTRGGVQQTQRFNPQQQGALSQLLSQGMQNTDFGPIEQRARSQFQTQTVPSIAERFTNMGQGAQRSSAFGQQMGRAGSDLESQLAALRAQYGMEQTQMGLTPQNESYYQQGQPGILQNLISMLPFLAMA